MAHIDIAAAKAARNVIYVITHDATGKQYVGQTRKTLWTRWRTHRNAAECALDQTYKTRTNIARAMRLHGVAAFSLAVLEAVGEVAELDAREAHWIATLGTMQPKGYNLCAGGKESKRAPSVGALIAVANRGRVKTPEWRRKLSVAHTGKKLSDQQKAQISAFHTGRTQSTESNAKRSASMTGFKYAEPYSQGRRDNISAGMTADGKARSRAAHIGVKRSDEIRQKLRDAWVRRRLAKAILNGGPTNDHGPIRRPD
jgi:group I intron endonuclease